MKTPEIDFQKLDNFTNVIHESFQHDFRHYSYSSLNRRLNRALIEFEVSDLTELTQKLLSEEKTLFPKLLSYLTVNTTEFFRDPEYFKIIKNEVVPYLKTFPSVKIWVAGCSTGEEVISLAILLREAGLRRYLLYATDINPVNLARAKRGIYDIHQVKLASSAYFNAGGSASLSDYYQTAYDSVKFDPSLLSNVVFSDHSLSTDSVFSEMHLISCRNVLIYFQKVLQDKVLTLFDQSLVRNGFLGLGSKETLQFTSVENHFKTINAPFRIFQKTSEV